MKNLYSARQSVNAEVQHRKTNEFFALSLKKWIW